MDSGDHAHRGRALVTTFTFTPEPTELTKGNTLFKMEHQQFHSYTPKKNRSTHPNTYTPILTAASFTVPQSRNNPNVHQLMNGQIKCAMLSQWSIICNKKWSTNTCHEMHESCKQDATWKKPVIKDHTQCHSTHEMFRKDRGTDTASRMKLDHYPTPHTKVNSKWIKGLNAGPRT